MAAGDLPPQSKPLDPEEATKQGRSLAEKILAQKPEQHFTNSGVLRIRNDGKRVEIPVNFEIFTSPTNSNWSSFYYAYRSNRIEQLIIANGVDFPNSSYFYDSNYHFPEPIGRQLTAEEITSPFAGSDFWLCDLGLKFFHWPEQKLLKSELRKTRLCRVLESINPLPATNAYSRVVSWIDDESRGILHAEAYDSQNKLLKEFDTKKFKQVKGEWQLEQMEIYNVQTRSRTQIEFNFDQ